MFTVFKNRILLNNLFLNFHVSDLWSNPKWSHSESCSVQTLWRCIGPIASIVRYGRRMWLEHEMPQIVMVLTRRCDYLSSLIGTYMVEIETQFLKVVSWESNACFLTNTERKIQMSKEIWHVHSSRGITDKYSVSMWGDTDCETCKSVMLMPNILLCVACKHLHYEQYLYFVVVLVFGFVFNCGCGSSFENRYSSSVLGNGPIG